MSQACMVCDEIVVTGVAFLVMRGEVDGKGKFHSQDIAGVVHEACLTDPDQRLIPLDAPQPIVVQT